MTLTRRHILLLGGAAALAACGQAPAPPAAPEMRAAANPAFDAWLAAFRGRAVAAGLSPGVVDRGLSSVGFLPGVVERDRNQIESRRTLEDYIAIAASDERIAKGRAALARHRGTLDRVEARYGVAPEVVTAIWGLESLYGERRGTIPVISSTATLAFDGRRGQFYEGQLIAALRILQRGDITAERMLGSWAGAMGHTQFIPTSFLSFAVDFTGDGRRDIWSDDPADSLASTAAYLSRNGWQSGLRWGSEAGTGGPAGRIVQPQAGGVRFAVTRNFDVFKTYNNSDFYAIGVGHLSDRLAGGGPLRGSFPPDANGLTRADRIAVQQGLLARGYDVGAADGVIGQRTEAALRAFQRRAGLPVTGLATRDVLVALG